MTETIQTLKEDIAILQEKLQKLEEQDPEMLLLRQGNIDIVDYDGKKYFRIEYTDSFADAYSWYVRKVGEDAIRPVRDVNVYAPLEELYKKEVVKQKDDYPYNPHKKYTPEETEKSLKETAQSLKEAFVKPQGPQKPLCAQGARGLVGPGPGPKGVIVGYEPTPQTPEQTEKSLKEAFVEAQQTENWKEIQKLIDEEDNDKNFKNSLDLIKEWGEKNKPPTLYQLIENWWCDVFCANSMDDMETCIDGLVDKIEEFLPKEHDTNNYKWNQCIRMIKSKLR